MTCPFRSSQLKTTFSLQIYTSLNTSNAFFHGFFEISFLEILPPAFSGNLHPLNFQVHKALPQGVHNVAAAAPSIRSPIDRAIDQLLLGQADIFALGTKQRRFEHCGNGIRPARITSPLVFHGSDHSQGVPVEGSGSGGVWRLTFLSVRWWRNWLTGFRAYRLQELLVAFEELKWGELEWGGNSLH